MSKIKKDHNKVIVQITITEIMRRAMLGHSKKLKGCPRPACGSISHFAFVAIKEKLKRDFGLDLEKLEPEVYQ